MASRATGLQNITELNCEEKQLNTHAQYIFTIKEQDKPTNPNEKCQGLLLTTPVNDLSQLLSSLTLVDDCYQRLINNMR